MATISNTPRPGYVWDSTDNVWYPIGVGGHGHTDYITQATAVNPTIIDAKGDIITATAADTPARLAVGTNNQVLTADSAEATGLKWATPASGLTLVKTASFTTAADTGTTFDGVFTSTYSTYLVEINWTSSANAEFYYKVRSGGSTYSTNYESNRIKYDSVNTFRSDQVTTQVQFGNGHSSVNSFVSMTISSALSAGNRTIGNWQSFAINAGAAFVGSFQQYSAVNHDGFILSAASGTITGTASVYGMAK